MEPDYPVLVTKRDGHFELRIRELLLMVRGPNLREAYTKLLERKREIVDWARRCDALDELPHPAPLPSLAPLFPVQHRNVLRSAWRAWFP